MSSSAEVRWSIALAAVSGLAVGVLLMTGFIAYKKIDLRARVAAPPPVQQPIEPEPDTKPSIVEAWIMAQQLVEQHMKGATSGEWGGTFADYQDPRKTVSDHGNGNYSIHAWVDSRDIYGTKQRYTFVCELQYEGNHYWHCSELRFLN